jgi:hypothetical protein
MSTFAICWMLRGVVVRWRYLLRKKNWSSTPEKSTDNFLKKTLTPAGCRSIFYVRLTTSPKGRVVLTVEDVGAGREVANEADISHEARIISLQDTAFWTAKIIVDILTV